ncbi:MAG: type IX secretion system sortase PorU, partial [Bacteroidia bacterium]|nr:type IX secretion system sortase PorU [Bacteroidia bacterium]
RVLTVEDIKNWTNFNRLSAFLTATCEFTRIDDPERTSAGEFVFLNSKGSGVALFTTSRLAFSGSNFSLCRSFNKFLFEPLNGSMPALGDICRLTKNDYRDPHVKNFLLVGDPAMKLAYPRWNVVTTSINNNVISATADTIKALTRVTISGEIRDDNGQLMTGFNGVLIPSIYDKEATYFTLGNDPGNPIIPFKVRKNVLFKGKATVTNGTFSFSFIMPKDISFQYGIGKISYYAFDGVTDAKGFYKNVIVGGVGSDTTVSDDKRGPEIKLYMNDDKFVSGGMTNVNPNVYALISDESGINTAGNGIGHDITITIDGDKLYTANDFFEADLDSYQKGKINFPLSGLSDGKHTLKLKVWDIFNNSSETTIEFYVVSSKEITLNHVYNYPNPFTTHTKFMFEHNRACVPMSVQIQVFTVTGKLVKTISKYLVCDGFRFDNLDWDGRDDYGDKIGRGIYIYRLRVQTSDGATADKIEKLVIL